jgi:Tfp pilus assembly protein PilF
VTAHNNLGAAYLSQRNNDAAAAEFRTALGIAPDNAEAHYNSALLAEEMGDKSSAVAHYDAFLKYGREHADLVPAVRSRIEALKR